ncbi:MAG: pantetheine-phosphate adenylyltransferase [Candidatus Brocadiia bacterium]
MGKALFPGSFDPVTYGHLDVIERASMVFEHLEVAVAVNPTKLPIFTVQERVKMLEGLTAGFKNVSVGWFEGLTVEYMRAKGIRALVRGIRTFADFEYEASLANANRCVAPEIETVFILSDTKYSFVSSRMIRELATYGGNVSAFVPQDIARELIARAQGKKPVDQDMR